jgi:hypothetical protein
MLAAIIPRYESDPMEIYRKPSAAKALHTPSPGEKFNSGRD